MRTYYLFIFFLTGFIAIFPHRNITHSVAPTSLTVNSYVLGYSAQKRPITLTEIGDGVEITLLIGVIHGNEPQGKYLIDRLMDELRTRPGTLAGRKVLCLPVLNPDGLARKTRTNANGVDINRNFPTLDWSPKYTKKKFNPGTRNPEPETKILMQVLETYNPQKIINIHTGLHLISYSEPAKFLAYEVSKYNHYPVKESVGYPTPGSFGTYAGTERGFPVVLLELPRGITGKKAWEQNKEALVEAVKFRID